MNLEQRLELIAKRFGDALRPYGFYSYSIHKEEMESTGRFFLDVVFWSKQRPRIGVWFDQLRDEQWFWFGFYGNAKQIERLVAEAPSEFHKYEPATKSEIEMGYWFREEVRNAILKNDGLTYEKYDDDDRDYFGRFDRVYDAASDDRLVTRGAELVGRIVRYIDPAFDEEEKDVEAIEKRKDLDSTTRAQLIQARRGQGKFRDDLLQEWSGTCALTGCAIEQVLRASHIRPWRDSSNDDRLNKHNGLLLSASVDALFDRGLISFDDSGVLMISPMLPADQKALLIHNEHTKLRRPELPKPQREFLRIHRERFFISY